MSEGNTQSTGAFIQSLKRNNQKIREDRATMISDGARMSYRRQIEDLEMKIKQMKVELDAMLDMSPTDANSLILASDFDSTEYANKDLDIAVKIRNEEIRLEVARKRFEHLFGETLTGTV